VISLILFAVSVLTLCRQPGPACLCNQVFPDQAGRFNEIHDSDLLLNWKLEQCIECNERSTTVLQHTTLIPLLFDPTNLSLDSRASK